MEELTLFARIFLAMVFISAAWVKTRHPDQHLFILRDYRIVPRVYLPLLLKVEIAAEWLVGALLFTGLFMTAGVVLTAGLLTAYSLAIVVNLFRGTRDLDCGCGGLAGNHKLSWWLVVRNLVFLLMCIWMWSFEGSTWSLDQLALGRSFGDVFDWKALLIVIETWCLILCKVVLDHLMEIRTRVRNLLGVHSE